MATASLQGSCESAPSAARSELPDAAAGHDSSTVAIATIGAEGGTLTSADGRATLEVPPGALPQAIEIRIVPVEPRPAGAVGPVYDFQPDGLVFDKPVVIRFELDPSLLDERLSSIRPATHDDGSWVPFEFAWLDYEGPSVAGLTTHFSENGPYELPNVAGETCECEADTWQACTEPYGMATILPCVSRKSYLWWPADQCHLHWQELAGDFWGSQQCYFEKSDQDWDDYYHCNETWRDCCKGAGGIPMMYAGEFSVTDPDSAACFCELGCPDTVFKTKSNAFKSCVQKYTPEELRSSGACEPGVGGSGGVDAGGSGGVDAGGSGGASDSGVTGGSGGASGMPNDAGDDGSSNDAGDCAWQCGPNAKCCLHAGTYQCVDWWPPGSPPPC